MSLSLTYDYRMKAGGSLANSSPATQPHINVKLQNKPLTI
jgi:hypothetical protein